MGWDFSVRYAQSKLYKNPIRYVYQYNKFPIVPLTKK